MLIGYYYNSSKKVYCEIPTYAINHSEMIDVNGFSGTALYIVKDCIIPGYGVTDVYYNCVCRQLVDEPARREPAPAFGPPDNDLDRYDNISVEFD